MADDVHDFKYDYTRRVFMPGAEVYIITSEKQPPTLSQAALREFGMGSRAWGRRAIAEKTAAAWNGDLPQPRWRVVAVTVTASAPEALQGALFDNEDF